MEKNLDPDEIATTVVNSFTGDEYWIDKDAAIAAVAAALASIAAAQRERDAQVVDAVRKRWQSTYDDTPGLSDAFLALIQILEQITADIRNER